MPTLAESNSVFQLAAGLNLIVSVIISDFDKAREQIGEVALRQLRDHVPEFNIAEVHRRFFLDFLFQSVRGLRAAVACVRILVGWSIIMAALSLAALYCTAVDPGRHISIRQFKWFFGLTLIVSPALYLLQNLLMRQIFLLLADRGLAQETDAQTFIRSFHIARQATATTRELKEKLQDAELFMFKVRWAVWWRSVRGAWDRMMQWIRR